MMLLELIRMWKGARRGGDIQCNCPPPHPKCFGAVYMAYLYAGTSSSHVFPANRGGIRRILGRNPWIHHQTLALFIPEWIVRRRRLHSRLCRPEEVLLTRNAPRSSRGS